MHNYSITPKSDIELANNVIIIERNFNSYGYFHTVPGYLFEPLTALPTTRGAANGYAFMSFANGSDQSARCIFRRPERWLNGIVRPRGIHYTSEATGGNFWGDDFTLETQRRNVVAPNSTVGPLTFTLPGPTTAHQFLYYDLTTINTYFLAVDTSIDWIGLKFNREGGNAADTSTGELRLIGVDFEYIEKPSARFIGENVDKPVVY